MTKLIKIAFIIDTIESPTAGTEKQLLLLLTHLNREKFQPYLCVLRSSPWLDDQFSICDLAVIGFHSFAQVSSYRNLLRFSSWLRRERIDIIQTHFAEGNKVGIVAGKLAAVPHMVATRRNQGYWHNKRELLILNILNKWTDHFIANAEDTKQWVIKTEKIQPDRVSVFYNALEINSFFKGTKEQRDKFRNQLGFASDTVVIGIVANLRPVKAIEVFIRAAQIVVQHQMQTGFVIVGEGPERASLEKLCHDAGVSDSIRFIGQCFDIPSVLSCLDIGVLASNSESFSNALIEYMAAGLAVVCTDVGGAREAIEEGLNGYVVQPGDYRQMARQINALIENNLYVPMGQQGIQKAEQLFSLNRILGFYEQFYEELL